MMKIALCTLMVFTTYITKAQSKKEQIENLTTSLDSLNQFVSKVQQRFDLEIKQSKININNLMAETNRLRFTSDSINLVLNEVKEKNLMLTQEVSILEKRVDSLKQQNLELKNVGSIDAPRSSNEFEIFLRYFLSTVYSEKKLDSLIYVSSPIILDFVDKNLGFGRFWNIGATCNLYSSDEFGYHRFGENYYGETEPNISNLSFFKNEKPKGGFCDEATSPNGIYYSQVNKLPESWDFEKDNFLPTPERLNNLKKNVVQIQYDYFIIQTFYFIESDNKWFLLYIYDCDCSA